MSINKLLAIFVLVAIGRTSACKGRPCPDPPVSDRYQLARRLLALENDDGPSYRVDESPIILRDDDSAYRKSFLFSGDTESKSGRIGAGFTLFGIPIEAQFGFENNAKRRPLRPHSYAFDQDDQERLEDEPEIVQIPASQRVVFTQQKMRTIKQKQMRRRAMLLPYDQYRHTGGEIGAGLNFLGIPLGSRLMWDKHDGEENDFDTKIRTSR